MDKFDLDFVSIFPTGTSWHQEYAHAEPWRHVVIDGLFDPAVLIAAELEQKERAAEVPFYHAYRQVTPELWSVTGPASEKVLSLMQSQIMTRLVSEITGISHLETGLSDLQGGVHITNPGGSTAVHRDFLKHPLTGLYHRANVILFLNSSWLPEYGGEFELWDRDRRKCRKKIIPTIGRLVIFESNDTTWHGLPNPLRCPLDRVRLSLTAYFYSREAPPATADEIVVIKDSHPRRRIWRRHPKGN